MAHVDTLLTVDRLAFSIEEAQQASTLSRRTLYRLIRRGQLRTVKRGARRLIPRVELERLCGVDALEAARSL
jgi:excisionase family DNA binding protein